jgi:8-oxo-dGTP pyrophosphatase MutT (NUDIX family)
MPNQQPLITDATGRRQFVCSPAAVLAFIVDQSERFLMLAHPSRPDRWEPVNGALDAEETILEAVLRETSEEAGDQIQVRPLGTVHAYTYRFDDSAQFMISIAYLLAYEGGEVIPGDDMTGSEVRWMTVEELTDGRVDVIVPQDQAWLYHRALELYRLWKDQSPALLQPVFDETTRNKYSR